jgi:hypothetical protein
MRGGVQWVLVNGEINRAQGNALRVLYKEYPELRMAAREYGMRKRAAVTGGNESLQRLEVMLEERKQ